MERTPPGPPARLGAEVAWSNLMLAQAVLHGRSGRWMNGVGLPGKGVYHASSRPMFRDALTRCTNEPGKRST